MTRWRYETFFEVGPRVRLDRETSAQWLAWLRQHRQPARVPVSALVLGRMLLEMLESDAEPDFDRRSLAARVGVCGETISRGLVRLRALGFLGWTPPAEPPARTEEGYSTATVAPPARRSGARL
jgi:hypothetical protein